MQVIRMPFCCHKYLPLPQTRTGLPGPVSRQRPFPCSNRIPITSRPILPTKTIKARNETPDASRKYKTHIQCNKNLQNDNQKIPPCTGILRHTQFRRGGQSYNGLEERAKSAVVLSRLLLGAGVWLASLVDCHLAVSRRGLVLHVSEELERLT
jgi:hypothetical protein